MFGLCNGLLRIPCMIAPAPCWRPRGKSGLCFVLHGHFWYGRDAHCHGVNIITRAGGCLTLAGTRTLTDNNPTVGGQCLVELLSHKTLYIVHDSSATRVSLDGELGGYRVFGRAGICPWPTPWPTPWPCGLVDNLSLLGCGTSLAHFHRCWKKKQNKKNRAKPAADQDTAWDVPLQSTRKVADSELHNLCSYHASKLTGQASDTERTSP